MNAQLARIVLSSKRNSTKLNWKHLATYTSVIQYRRSYTIKKSLNSDNCIKFSEVIGFP